MRHYLVPENILNEFVSKIVKNGDRITATIKAEKNKSKKDEKKNLIGEASSKVKQAKQKNGKRGTKRKRELSETDEKQEKPDDPITPENSPECSDSDSVYSGEF